MSDLSEEDNSMEEDDSGEDEESSEEEESAGESEGGSDSESADEENQSGSNESFIENVQQQDLSSSSDEGTERDRCPICLNRFIGQDLGIPENCEHIFCFECIKEWGSNINTCPIDRNEFNFVHLKGSPDGKVLKKVRVRVRSKEPEEGTVAEENTLCEVCRMGDREHRLLLCDACDLAYHCDCLDPPLFHIPIEEWFCPPCASVMTQMGQRALPSTSRARRVIPRTRASETVRVRVQNRRAYPSTSSPRSTSTQRPKKRKRRTYRRCIRKVVNLARTKAAGSSGKGGKSGRATAVMVTYRKKYKRRKRRKTKKTSRKTRLPSASAESNLQSAKERIAKRLGLCKGRTGTAIPDVRSKPGPSSQGSSSDRTHSLFGARDQLMDFSENFNEYTAVPSTSTSTPRNVPGRSETNAAPSNLLDSILAGQEILHAKSDNVIIRNDGSLIRKEGEKKKTAKETSNTSKSVVRVGLCKPEASKHATPERSSSLSLLHGALTKKKSSESHFNPQQKPGTSSHNSTKDVSKKTRKIKKQEDKDGSSRLSKKSSDLYSKNQAKPIASLSTSSVISSKSPFKTDKLKDKYVSLKDKSSTLNNNSTTNSCDPYFACKSTRTNLSDNKKQSGKSQKALSSNMQDSVPDHRLDILQKRASFLEKFNTKPTVSEIKHISGDSSGIQQSSLLDETNVLATTGCSNPSLAVKSSSPKTNEIKIKDEPLSSDDEEAYSESLIGQADKFFLRTLKKEFQASESLIGNCGTDQFSYTTLNSSTTMDSSELGVVKHNFIKKEPVSSDEESISPISDNPELFGFRVQIKEEPDASAEDVLNNLPFRKAAESFEDLPCTQAVEGFENLSCTQAVECFEDLPCTQAVENFEDLPCTQAAEHFEDLPCTQAVECFEDLPCTQAVYGFEDLPCTQAAERFEDLPCTKAAECFEDLPCTQAVERFEDLPCTQAVECFEDLLCMQAVEGFGDLTCTKAAERFEDLPCTQAAERFEDLSCTQAVERFEDLPCTQAAERFEDLPCTQAVERFEDLPCTQAVERFEDLPCTQVTDIFPNETVFKVPKSKLPLNDHPRHTSEPSIPHKLSSNHSKLKNSNALVEDSDLPATQPSAQEMPNVSAREISISKKSGTKNSTPSSKQENKKDHSLLNTQILEDEELLEAKKAIALLRSECNKVKTPPKVMGVHRNLPQVITSVPARRPLVPKPINKRTFSFEQVKQHFNLEEPQESSLSDTETSSKLSSQFKSVIKTKSHWSSDSNAGPLSKLRPINASTTTPSNNIHASLPEKNSKGLVMDYKSQKMSNHLLGALSDSKLIKSSLNEETMQDVSNIENNVVIKPTQCLKNNSNQSKEQFQPPSSIPQTLLQTDYLASHYVKKEPLDINEDIVTENHCTVKKVDEHIGESNLARALRIKREMNAEVLQQNAFKERIVTTKVPGVRNITDGSSILRRLSVKQEMNLELMTENLLHASLENSRHKAETHKSSLVASSTKEKETISVRIKIEKDDELHINQSLEKGKSICKEKEFKLDAKCIKKEPKERLEKCTKTKSYYFDKTLENNKKGKSDICNKEVKKESNSEKRYKHIESDKCRETNPQIKNKDIHNKRNSDKYTEKDHGHKESNFERKSKFQEKESHDSKERKSDGNKTKAGEDRYISNERSSKHAVKDQDHRGNDSDRKTKCLVKDSKGRNSDMKNDCVDKEKRDSKISIPDSRNKQVDKNKHCSVESNSCSKKKNTEKDEQDNMERSSASNNIHAEKDINNIKKSNFDRKNKQLKNYEHDSNEKSCDAKKKHGEKDKHDSKNINSYNKDKHDKKDKHSSRVNNFDRKHKHTENDKHCRKGRVYDSKFKHDEKDHYDVKESKSDRNTKPILKDSKDGYSDSNTEKDKHNKEINCDRKNKHTEKDKQNTGSEYNKNNKHTEKDKFSNKKSDFISKHGEKETHKNHIRKELTENFEVKRHCKENNQTKKGKEMSGKHDRMSGTSDQFKDEIKIKKEAPSIENRKRSFEATSIDFHSDKSNHENKRRKISTEVNKQNLSTSSKSCTSPDSTSGPDTSERLSTFGSSKHEETLLDARIRKMMSHDDCDTRSSKKQRHESMCSEDTSGCFSDISQLSNELLLKAEVISFNSPKLGKVGEQKHSASSLKSSSKVQKASQELKEEIATEIKLILKPFFTVGVVNKEDYKDIMRKAVPKVFLNCGSCVNPDKIKKLVLGYVAKLKSS